MGGMEQTTLEMIHTAAKAEFLKKGFQSASLRNIVNTEEALETIEAVTGVKVEVLSGADEAAFSFLGATVGGGAPGSGMLADVGGGSTELVSYRNRAIQSACSLSVGSLSLFSKYVSKLHPTKEERRAIRRAVEEQLEQFLQRMEEPEA